MSDLEVGVEVDLENGVASNFLHALLDRFDCTLSPS